MTIEKVYDELYGMIDDLKKQIAASGGSDVTITPALESGTKIADYTIGEDEGVLYAPTPPDPYTLSTTEHIIGSYDGIDLYVKLFKNVSLTSEQWTTLGLTGVNVVDCFGLITCSLISNKFPLTFYLTATSNCNWGINSTGDVRIQPNMASESYGTLTADIIVYYTKVSSEAKKTTKKK